MTTKNHFAVYEHIRPDTGQVFYVGKGAPDRLRSVTRRHNKYHSRIYNKMKRLGLTVEQHVIATNLPEESAHIFEKMRIMMWRAMGAPLVNMTEGGEGLSNPSEETRARIGAASKVRQNKPESKDAVSAVHKGKKVSKETKAKISAKATAQFADPTARKKASENTANRFADAEEREKQRKRITAFFDGNIVAREAAADRTREQFADPAKRERHRQACIAALARKRDEKAQAA